ncbi:hypothetical protein GGI21_004048 [Coemansia aciculifera]|nr:hypothetical protein GGI21_004048 [Coemansia aciculifera]
MFQQNAVSARHQSNIDPYNHRPQQQQRQRSDSNRPLMPEEITRSARNVILGNNKQVRPAPVGYMPMIMVDGPYGAPTQHVFDYSTIVLVGGGIGVTPMCSVLKSLYYQLTIAPHLCNARKVHFLWVCRDVQALVWFQDLLAALDEEDIGSILEIRTYLTGELPIDQIRNIALYQDPNGRDAVTGLYRSPTYYGRPNFDRIFEDIGTRNPETDIGVFVCGPKSMSQSIRGIKEKWNRVLKPNKTKFVLHEEKF